MGLKGIFFVNKHKMFVFSWDGLLLIGLKCMGYCPCVSFLEVGFVID